MKRNNRTAVYKHSLQIASQSATIEELHRNLMAAMISTLPVDVRVPTALHGPLASARKVPGDSLNPVQFINQSQIFLGSC